MNHTLIGYLGFGVGTIILLTILYFGTRSAEKNQETELRNSEDVL